MFFGKAYNNVDDMSYTLDESAEKCLYEIIQEVDADYYSAFFYIVFSNQIYRSRMVQPDIISVVLIFMLEISRQRWALVIRRRY